MLERAGARAERGRALRARHDRRHQRAARGTHRAHRADRHRGLHRRDRARPPGAAAPVPAVRAGARAARARRSCASRRPSGWAPTGPLRALDRRRRARAGRASSRARAPRGGGRGAAALLRRPRARAAARRAARRAAARRRTCRSPASWSAPSASTSAPPRPCSTRRSRRCSAPTSRSLRAQAPRERGLPEPQVMQSSGGLTDAARAGAHAALTVLSGPAGGVGGALLLAELAGEPRRALLRHGRHLLRRLPDRRRRRCAETAERAIAGRPLALPALDIHTVGAGGGSIAWRDPGGALRVGPASAGADPGPACYGRGGARADRHRRQPAARPPARGLAAGGRRSRSTATAAERAVARARARARPRRARLRARGSCAWPRPRCCGALRVMTVERGIDPRGFALMPFGGAGPLHAAALAGELGIARVLCPRASGVLCALGLAAAAPRRDVARTVHAQRRRAHRPSASRERASACVARGRAPSSGAPGARSRVRYELRYRGQSFELPVDEELERRRAAPAARPRRAARGVRRARTSAATATATTRPRSSW